MTPRHVFICGLHRSGTSILNRMLQRHPDVTGFSGTGASEDEGQHLQAVIPHDGDFGGPGSFCFDPRARLTEQDLPRYEAGLPLIKQAWAEHWDPACPVRVEKSPTTLIRSRFFQAGFAGARFVFIVRHPLIVSMATRKWSESSVEVLINHWLAGHRIMLADLPRLADRHVVRYEDIAHDPEAALAGIWHFIGVGESVAAAELFGDRSGQYLEQLGQSEPLDQTRLDGDAAEIMARFGYSLDAPYTRDPGAWRFDPAQTR